MKANCLVYKVQAALAISTAKTKYQGTQTSGIFCHYCIHITDIAQNILSELESINPNLHMAKLKQKY